MFRPVFEHEDLPDCLPDDVRRPVPNLLPDNQEGLPAPMDNGQDTHKSSNIGNDESGGEVTEDSASEYQADEESDWEEDMAKKAKSTKRTNRAATASLENTPSSVAKSRVAGGAPPVRKKVCAEGDSDDEVIWEMKQKGFRDQKICEHLIETGRIRYDVKTIATRYARIKKAKLAAQEKKLEMEFDDYHVSDDEALYAAVQGLEAKQQKELADIEDRHWANVAEAMNAKLAAPKFTKKLAKERYEALQNGTAPVPFEKDPNPEARIARVQQEKAERYRIREEEEARANEEQTTKETSREKAAREKRETKAETNRKRNEKKAAAAAKKAVNQTTAEAAADARRIEIEQKAATKVQQLVDRERRKQEVADKKADNAWKKKLQMAELRQQKQQEKLQRAQEVADKKAEVIRQEIEETKRKELIRRHMRLSGAAIAAPMMDPPSYAVTTAPVKSTTFSKQMASHANNNIGTPVPEVVTKAATKAKSASESSKLQPMGSPATKRAKIDHQSTMEKKGKASVANMNRFKSTEATTDGLDD